MLTNTLFDAHLQSLPFANISDSNTIGYYSYEFAQGCDFTLHSSELKRLRAHVDEAKDDPDYSIVVSYESIWE